MKKRTLSILLICSILCTMFYGIELTKAYTDTVSGSCGESLAWSLNTENGKLTVSGAGKMTDYAFGEAPWMTYADFIGTVEVQEGVVSVGSYAFCFLEQIEGELLLPESLQIIGSYAFQNCYGLSGSLKIPDSVERIEDNAFDGCEGFDGTLTLGKGLAYIGECAFYGCTGLTGNLTVPDGVQFVGNGAFAECGFTGTVQIGAGLASEKDSRGAITGKTFENCTGIQAFSVAKDNPNLCAVDGVLYTKDKSTVLCCPAGKGGAVTVEPAVKIISENAFLSCKQLTGNLVLPEGLTKIGENAFRNCRGFSGILTVPDSVERIGDGAFQNCSGFSERIVLGSGVEHIGAKAFSGCTGVQKICFRGNAPEIDTGYKTASFPSDVCLYFQSTASGWDYPEWCGYETAIWSPEENGEPSDDPEDDPQESAEYRHFIRLEDETGRELAAFTEQTTEQSGNTVDRVYHKTEEFGMEQLSAGETLPQSLGVYFPGNTHYLVAAQGHKNLSGTFADADITTTVVLTRRECRTETEYQWKQDGKTGKWTCTAQRYCIYDGCTETAPQTETATEENGGIRIEVTATCTENGSRNAVASFSNVSFETKTKQLEAVSALGHRWAKNADGSGIYTVDREATETQEGQKSVHCTVCGAVNPETVTVIPKLVVIPTLSRISLEGSGTITITEETKTNQTVSAAAFSEKNAVLTDKVLWTVSPTGQSVTIDAAGKITVQPDAKAGIYTVSAAPVEGKTAGKPLEITLTVQKTEIFWPDVVEKTGNYGEKWEEIVSLSDGAVRLGGSELNAQFRLLNGSAYPNAGEQSYSVECTYTLSGKSHTVVREYADAVVLPKEITILSAVVQEKAYNGRKDDARVKVTFGGLENGETLTAGLDYTVSGQYQSANAGDAVNVTVTVTLLNTARSENYRLAFSSFQTTGRITAQSAYLVIEASDAEYTGRVYAKSNIEVLEKTEGLGNPTYSYYETSEDAEKQENALSGTPKNAGTYWVRADVKANGNIEAVSAIDCFTIVPVTLNAENFAEYFEYDLTAVTYNGKTQPVSVTLKSSYSAKGTTTIRYNQETERPKNAGNYRVTVDISGGTNFRAAEGILLGEYRILPRTVNIVWNAETVYYYDREPVTVTATAADPIEGDKVAITVSGGQNTAVGSYTATALAAENANYQLAAENRSFSYEIRYAVTSVSVLAPQSCSVTLDQPKLTVRFSGTVRDELRYRVNGTGAERRLTKAQIQSGEVLTFTENGVAYRLDCSAVRFEEEKEEGEPKVCEGLRRIPISEGRHTLYLNGEDAGTFIFARYGNGWTVYDESRKQYLSFNDAEKVFRYSTEPFAWNLEDGFFTETESEEITPFAARIGTVRSYLTQENGSFTVGILAVTAQIYEWGKGEHIWEYRAVNGREHEIYCTVCGESRREEHHCDTETELCICGYRKTEPEAPKLKITVKTIPNEDIQHWRMTYYRIEASGMQVSRIEYSTNGGETWEEGTEFALLEEVKTLKVRVTDAEGVYYVTDASVDR